MHRIFKPNREQVLSEKSQTINIGNKLPNQPDCVIKQIDSGVLAKETGMKAWSRGYVYTKETALLVIPELKQAIPHFDDAAMTKLNNAIEQTSQKLCLAPMGATGLGVFALDTINSGEPIGIYAGSIKSMPLGSHIGNSSKNEYALDFANLKDETYAMVQAKNYGNLTRFIQHAPRKTLPNYAPQVAICLDDYHFLEIERTKVATANLKFELTYHQDELVYYLVASEKITKGQMLAWDYNIHYWHTKETAPELFTTYGEIINRNNYRPRSLSIRISFDSNENPIDLVNKLLPGQYYNQKDLSELVVETPYGHMACISQAEIIQKFNNTPLLFIRKKSYAAWLAESPLQSQPVGSQFFSPSTAFKDNITKALKQLAKEFGIPKGAQYDLKIIKPDNVALIKYLNKYFKV